MGIDNLPQTHPRHCIYVHLREKCKIIPLLRKLEHCTILIKSDKVRLSFTLVTTRTFTIIYYPLAFCIIIYFALESTPEPKRKLWISDVRTPSFILV